VYQDFSKVRVGAHIITLWLVTERRPPVKGRENVEILGEHLQKINAGRASTPKPEEGASRVQFPQAGCDLGERSLADSSLITLRICY